MLRYELTRLDSQGNPIRCGTITLSDDARGADQYLSYRQRGFQFRKLESDTE